MAKLAENTQIVPSNLKKGGLTLFFKLNHLGLCNDKGLIDHDCFIGNLQRSAYKLSLASAHSYNHLHTTEKTLQITRSQSSHQ